MNDGFSGFIFREPSTAAIHIALLPRSFRSTFVVPAVSRKLRKFRGLTASLTYTETGSNGLRAWHAVRVLPSPPRSRALPGSSWLRAKSAELAGLCGSGRSLRRHIDSR